MQRFLKQSIMDDSLTRQRYYFLGFSETIMCRYAMHGPYKRHFVCFSCRKAFKQPPIVDFLAVQGLGYAYVELSRIRHHAPSLERRERELNLTLAGIESKFIDITHNCPECSELMIDMGLDFKTPRQSDTKAWRNLHGMYRVGHAFHTCGCDGPGWIPVSTSDYVNYLASRKRVYLTELARAQKSSELDADQRRDAAMHWQSRIDALEAELATVT